MEKHLRFKGYSPRGLCRADNVTANSGSGGATFATDQRASDSVHFPLTKLVWGALDTFTVVDTGAGALPIADGGNSITIDGSLTNISGTISLPTGAATAAKQPALGTAGSASTDVITVQGIASGTAVAVSLASVPSHAVTNAGTFAVQVDGSALTSLQLIDDPVIADDAAFTPATSKVMMAGFQADETATDSVDEGDAGAVRMTLDRKLISTPQPHTAGGLSISRDIDLDNGSLTVVKASAGQLYGWDITNTSAVTVFVKFYDATSGTLGTGTPVMTVGIPGNTSDDTLSSKSLSYGIAFATGICVGAGTGVADADNTDPGTNAVVANIYYK